jgi:hypothetical protein
MNIAVKTDIELIIKLDSVEELNMLKTLIDDLYRRVTQVSEENLTTEEIKFLEVFHDRIMRT